jgi:phage portal protein BeeE
MTPGEQSEIQKAMDKRVGGASKFGKNVITPAKIDVNSLGLTSQQMQVLEGVVIDRRTLCNIFKVDSSLFNDKEASTFNNMKSVSKSVYERAVVPNNQKVISGYDGIIPAYNDFEGKELRIVQDLSNIPVLQEDQETKAKKDNTNINSIATIMQTRSSVESKIETLVNIMKIDRDKAILIVGKEIKEDEKN